MTAVVTAGAGFLLAVLWFDLMHDVQVRGHAGPALPEPVVASIARYYRRVTTEAHPMNRLVALAMVVTLAGLVAQLVGDASPAWAVATSLVAAVAPIALAAARTVPSAVRLGRREDPLDVQSRLARRIHADHWFCLVSIAVLLVLQLGWVR
ncbi:MAG TPA: hypothetical protein VF152_11980 [Acidimicrobiia bacterium]